MVPPEPDKPPRRPKETYDPQAVDRVFGFVRWMHDRGLSNPAYYVMAVTMIPAYYVLVNLANRLEIHHRERLPPTGTGFFLLCNHISILDGQVLSMMTFPRTYWYPSKAGFYRSTAQGLGYTALTGFKSFPVRRGERDVRAMDLIESLLARGESVLLFPEGTRSEDGSLGTGKVGVGKIIHDARPLVVPCYLEGFADILPRGKLLPRTGLRSHINFGDPLALDDLFDRPSSMETSQEIVDRVMEAITGLRDELRAEE